jgi:fructose-1-phosphate kinase PfkB-like protein
LAIALNEGAGFVEGLRLGTAAGAATAMVAGTHLADADQVLRLLPGVVVRALTPA